MEELKTVLLCFASGALLLMCVIDLWRFYCRRQRARVRLRRQRERRARLLAEVERAQQATAQREREKERFYLRNFWEYDGGEQQEFDAHAETERSK